MKSFIARFDEKIRTGNLRDLSITNGDRKYSGEETVELIKKVSLYLNQQGIREGTRVALISDNRPEFLIVLFALLYLKSVPVSIDYYHKKDIKKLLIEDEPFLIAPDNLSGFKGKFIELNNIVSKARRFDLKSFYPLFSRRIKKPVSGDKIFIILCSSGTTSISKKVLYSEKNIEWATREYSKLYDFNKNRSIAYIVPTHYSLGILACGLIPIYSLKTVLITEGKKIKSALKKISENKINILPGTPTIFNKVNKMNLNNLDFSNLRVCDSGGQILPIAIINKFSEVTNVVITEGYGLTETSSLTHFLVPDSKGKLRLGSCGKPCKDVKCKLIDRQGKEVGKFKPGELVVSGPQNMLGYDNHKLNQDIFINDFWIRTGDILYRDEEDFYYLVSRKIDLMENTYFDAVEIRKLEEYLYSLDEIKEGTSIVAQNGEVIIFVTLLHSTVDKNFVKEKILKEQPSKLTIRDIRIVDIIPRTSTYKVKRDLLQVK